MSVNGQLFDASLRHEIGLRQYSGGVLRLMLEALEATEVKLQAELAARLSRVAILGKDPGPWTTGRLESMLVQLKQVIGEGYARVATISETEMVALAQWEVEYQMKMLGKTVGKFGLSFKLPSAERIKAIATARPLDGAIMREWYTGMAEQQKLRIAKVIRLGLLSGDSHQVIERAVAAAWPTHGNPVAKRHMESLVRTYTTHVATQARQDLYFKNRDVVEGVQWIATFDERTTQICQGLDGEVWLWNPDGSGNYLEGSYGHPAPPGPPAHFRCRSTLGPFIGSWENVGLDMKDLTPGQRASMDGTVPGRPTMTEWMRGQNQGVQNRAMGRGKAEVFRAHPDAHLSRFLDSDLKPINLDRLIELDAADLGLN